MTAIRSVSVLGSTGSIGTQTIDLLAAEPDRRAAASDWAEALRDAVEGA